MPEQPSPLRPEADHFTRFGADVTIVDPTGLLAAVRTGPVEVFDGTDFPAPVRRVRLALRRDVEDDHPVHRFMAEIRTGAPGGALDNPAAWLLVGVGPVGLLLARRLAAVEPTAGRVLAQAGRVVAEAGRRLGLPPPPTGAADPTDPAARTDPAGRTDDPAGAAVLAEAADLGLTPVVRRRASGEGTVVTVRADRPGDALTPAHLRVAFALVLQVVRELAADGADPVVLRGRRYVLDAGSEPGPAYQGGPAAGSPRRADQVTLDQVGGLDEVVAQFREIAVSFRHPEVMARWGARRPQGILLYGPPGTGKTMLARALANEIGAVFREIRTPEILDKWLGGSERNIKQIFRDARRWREPTVMLFDEFDSIISYAGAGGDAASQAVNAVAGIFKQEMNTLIEENPNVIVMATTNFPHRVDASLIRSGRFDVKLAIPLPDETGRAQIITKMIRDLMQRHEAPPFRMFGDDVDPADLATRTAGMTGADLREILRRVQLAKAMREAVDGVPADPISQRDLIEHTAALHRA
ncbi:26S protease regulatory subunit [Plantactinospora sp. KBS50]|uniref:ATP-binding protein n=1 Tax=Plantactinospora sp. KBS50 TaxID=2024580 RepID=UPI000BAAD13C|nr:ATP-binding protein [Plantactinospora sp. KBS50]ASW54363.1 AAA family ATPase [Plantactinospora sp. KBS50]